MKRESGCLVTGGAGFIGCALSAQLVHQFGRVVVLDNLHPQIHRDARRPEALHAGVELVVGDVCNPADWDGVLGGFRPEVVIHLAAETGTGQSLTEASRHAQVNVVGTTQMLDAFVRHRHVPRRFLLSSSRAVYGEGAWRRADGTVFYPGQRSQQQLEQHTWDFPGAAPCQMEAELLRPAPTSVYGATKLTQEHLLSCWALSFGAELATLRLQNVYGPGQSLINSYTGIVSLFVRMARAGQSIPLYEDGLMQRDFVLIDDVAAALTAAILAPAAPGMVLDVGTGVPTTIADVANIIAKRYGAPAPHVCAKFRNGDVRHAVADIGRTRRALGWEPRFGLVEGLNRLCDWIESQEASA